MKKEENLFNRMITKISLQIFAEKQTLTWHPTKKILTNCAKDLHLKIQQQKYLKWTI